MTTPEREDGAPWRNFYGRRRGKTLRKGQAGLMDTLLADAKELLVSKLLGTGGTA